MNLAGEAVRTKDERLPPLEHWSDDTGHIVVIGEAAHRLNVSIFSSAIILEKKDSLYYLPSW